MNRIRYLLVAVPALAAGLISGCGNRPSLPEDFLPLAAERFAYVDHIVGAAGGAGSREDSRVVRHYPVIMIPGDRRGRDDWFGAHPGNAPGTRHSVYRRLVDAGFSPSELWVLEYTREGREMRNIEEITDNLRAFIYAVLWYTGAPKVQILAHGEGCALAHATLKKYNLYNLVHAEVLIGGPMHGAPLYSYQKALHGFPVHANLAPHADFLQDMLFPDETPYNVAEHEEDGAFAVKYLTLCSLGDEYYRNYPQTALLHGAEAKVFERPDHDGLRVSDEAAAAYIPFLSDPAKAYDPRDDRDGDGFMSEEAGGADTNDNDPSVYPGAREVPDDGIDQDCNYRDKSSAGGRDGEVPLRGAPLQAAPLQAAPSQGPVPEKR